MSSNISTSDFALMEASDDDGDYTGLKISHNRKNKKAGGWQQLGLDYPIFKGIIRKGYKQPTPIQRKTIPPILDGQDVVGMSRTGSGKTAAFVVPMLQKLKKRDPTGIRALLLSPTRELALQTFKVVKELGRFTGLRCECLVGGDSMDNQFAVLHEHPDILLATPGRLLHLMVEMNLKLRSVNYLVFDEADRLFEMGFSDQLHEILKRIPESRQTLLFSATLPKMLVDFAKAGLCNPTLIRLDLDSKLSENLQLILAMCRQNDKISTLLYLCRILVSRQQKTIVFCATMKYVEYISSIFREAELDCAFLYSQLDPVARNDNINRFRANECSLLIVTDVAARGVDIPVLDVAINFHFPSSSKLFVHRVGRVARAGRSGSSISLIAPDEFPYLVDLMLYLGRPIKFAQTGCVADWTNDALVGRIPQNLTHLEREFLLNLHGNSIEVKELQSKSENSMKKYSRTRPQPSSESVSRSKKEFRQVQAIAHPFFSDENLLLGDEINDDSKKLFDQSDRQEQLMLEGIHGWRPNATIFEINKSGRHQPNASTANAVMKSKRREHERYLSNKKTLKSVVSPEEVKTEIGDPDIKEKIEGVFEKTIEDSSHVLRIEKFEFPTKALKTDSVCPSKVLSSKEAKRVSAEERRELERSKFYVAYQPSDMKSEKVLSVEHNTFDAQAKLCGVDISADDDKQLYLETQRKRWDRKRKRFVGEDESKKKIRTEEGTWLPASYKSGRYEAWVKNNKLSYKHQDEEENQEDNERLVKSRYNSRVPPRHHKGKSSGERRSSSLGLKRPEQIMKERRRKSKITAYQTHRHEENAKKKEYAGKAKGSARNGNHNKRR